MDECSRFETRPEVGGDSIEGERIKAVGFSRMHCNPQHEAARSLRDARIHVGVRGGWGTVSTCPSHSSITSFGVSIVWTVDKAFLHVPQGNNSFTLGNQEDTQPTVMDAKEAWKNRHSKIL